MNDQRPIDESGSLIEFLLPLAAGWRALLATSLTGTVIGASASFLVQPQFTAATTFMPPQQPQGSAMSAISSLGAVAGLAAGAAGIRNPADQYVSLMQSVTVSDRIIEQFKLKSAYRQEFLDGARRELVRHVQFNVGKKDGLITVSVEAANPDQAAAIANQYVEELRRMAAGLALTDAQQRRVFFEGQLKETKERLIAAQQALEASGFNAGAIKAEPKAATESYAKLRAELTSSEVKLQIMRGSLAETAPEIRAQLALVQALRDQVRQLEQTEGAISGKGADYVGRYREFKYQEALFDIMAKQYEAARMDESREGTLIQVIDPANPPERKSRPNRIAFGAMFGLLAFIACSGVLIFRARKRLNGDKLSWSERLAAFKNP